MLYKFIFSLAAVFCFTTLLANDDSSIEDTQITESQDIQDAIDSRNLRALEGNTIDLEDIQNDFNQLRSESQDVHLFRSSSRDLSEDKKELIIRKGHTPDATQNVSLSKKVHKILKQKSVSGVDFGSDIEQFDYLTCSAMALDFLTRFQNASSNLNTRTDFANAVTSFSPFYEFNNTTFISRQSAYNTIKVKNISTPAGQELIRYNKMQSLANYHGLKLKPATKTIKIGTIQNNPENFKQTITNLPNGRYVVRALSPTNNKKMESYGHTMILIKDDIFSVYYDNGYGAVDITDDVSGFVKDKILSWSIPEVRFYSATCSDGGCTNASAETYVE